MNNTDIATLNKQLANKKQQLQELITQQDSIEEEIKELQKEIEALEEQIKSAGNTDKPSGEIIFPDEPTNVSYPEAITSQNLINEGILIANESETLTVGDEIKIIAHILPYDVLGSNPYIISSSNEEIITIIGGKVIKAVAEGEAIITAYTTDGKYKDTVQYQVIEQEVVTIEDREIYNLEMTRFNIIETTATEDVAKNNSLGINAALKFCSRYGYKKIVFPENKLIYIEPKISIYMVSNLVVDLNGSELEIIPNKYTSYTAIYFREGNIDIFNGFDISDETTVTFLDTDNVIKTTLNSSQSIYSNAITVRAEKAETEYNQSMDYLVYGDTIDFSLQIARNTIKVDDNKYASATAIIYVDYYNSSTLVKTEKVQDLWISSNTAQYFSDNNPSFTLRGRKDYNSIKIRLAWTIKNAKAEIYIGTVSLRRAVSSVLTGAKLINGKVIGEREGKSDVYPNWENNWDTEGGCSIIFYEGENNGIENMTVKESIGFNMSNGLGKDSFGVVDFEQYPITIKNMELGDFDDEGNVITSSDFIITKDYIDISKITTAFYDIGYPLGYMGYPYVSSRIFDICFYDLNKKFIRKDRGRLRFRRYSKPEDAYYAKVLFYSNEVPTRGNTDFYDAFAFIENFQYPMKNFIKNCIIEENYSCGWAACGGQKWRVENNIWRNNGGREPNSDIDWEDGWDYMQGDLVIGNSFESYNNVNLSAGLGQIFEGNTFNSHSQLWGRSQYWSVINNEVENTTGIAKGSPAKLTLSSSSDAYIEGNVYNKSSVVWGPGNTSGKYELMVKNETFNDGNVLNGSINKISRSTFTGDCSIYSDNIIECNISSGTVTTNANIQDSNLITLIIRPAKDSTVSINKCYMYNSTIQPMVQCDNVAINNTTISRDKFGALMNVASSSTGGIVVTDSVFVFDTATGYNYLIGGWNANNCEATYTFDSCSFDVNSDFKGYLIECSWYAAKDSEKHITINVEDSDVSMFEKTNEKGLKSNIVFNIEY